MTIDELRVKEKTLHAVVSVVAGLAAVYPTALGFWWLSGRWTPTQTLGVVPLFARVAAAFPAGSSRRQVRALLRQRSGAGGSS